MAFVAKENLEFIPGDLRAERVRGEKYVEGFGSRAAGESCVEYAVRGDRGFRGFNKYFRGPLGDSCAVRENFNFAIGRSEHFSLDDSGFGQSSRAGALFQF